MKLKKTMSPKIYNLFIFCVTSKLINTSEQVAQRGCQVSVLGDTQNPTGQGPGQPALSDPPHAGGLD